MRSCSLLDNIVSGKASTAEREKLFHKITTIDYSQNCNNRIAKKNLLLNTFFFHDVDYQWFEVKGVLSPLKQKNCIQSRRYVYIELAIQIYLPQIYIVLLQEIRLSNPNS